MNPRIIRQKAVVVFAFLNRVEGSLLREVAEHRVPEHLLVRLSDARITPRDLQDWCRSELKFAGHQCSYCGEWGHNSRQNRCSMPEYPATDLDFNPLATSQFQEDN